MKQRVFRSFNEIMLAQIKDRQQMEAAKEEAELKPASFEDLHKLVQHFNRNRHA